MADIFDVIADSTRRDILHLLRERGQDTPAAAAADVSVSEIVAALGLSQPTVSKHLKVLREADLVHVREDGQHRFYRVAASPLEEIEDWLMPFLDAEAVTEDVLTLAGLAPKTRELADAIGHAAAGTTYRVASAVEALGKKLPRPKS